MLWDNGVALPIRRPEDCRTRQFAANDLNFKWDTPNIDGWFTEVFANTPNALQITPSTPANTHTQPT
jgi:hypothetical protein